MLLISAFFQTFNMTNKEIFSPVFPPGFWRCEMQLPLSAGQVGWVNIHENPKLNNFLSLLVCNIRNTLFDQKSLLHTVSEKTNILTHTRISGLLDWMCQEADSVKVSKCTSTTNAPKLWMWLCPPVGGALTVPRPVPVRKAPATLLQVKGSTYIMSYYTSLSWTVIFPSPTPSLALAHPQCPLLLNIQIFLDSPFHLKIYHLVFGYFTLKNPFFYIVSNTRHVCGPP